jgi:hypothetical protein
VLQEHYFRAFPWSLPTGKGVLRIRTHNGRTFWFTVWDLHWKLKQQEDRPNDIPETADATHPTE